MFKQTLLPIWSLLFGIALITGASALQSSLIGIRASIESFDTTATGLIMSSYYIGFIIGSLVVPDWVKNVGHIRVFAAVASLASITILMQSVVVNPWFWMLMRMGTGVCYAALFIVTESWLNAISTNTTRGRLFSVYIIEVWASQTLGQFLLNVGSPSGFELFILTSVLISFALVPLLLVRTPSPTISVPEKLNMMGLVKSAPLGVTGVLIAGVTSGSLLGLGALYAKSIGLNVAEISLFIGASYLGGMLLQWPIGKLSDRQDRRFTLMWVALIATGVSLLVPFGNQNNELTMLLAGMFCIGAFNFPLYSLASSHINDQLRPEQILSASSGIILLNGAGGAMGPLIAAALMDIFEIDALFWFLAGMNLLVCIVAAYRIKVQPPMVIEDQSDQIPVGIAVSSVATAEMLVEADTTNTVLNEEVNEVEIKL
ncbi:MFS transporter [Marinomonas mediterranea]|uniref:Major facilitator superfamily MFS_1 n=1 Tax=Marinomonas mediterranea (strain ATCC 700492 / JCM 21426 / NBRC 103028 / MMB-1) TaxID=717774 RepID=F2K484_MARM1|nr:MFS transporter [Marinomonas mediterranea]ADZ92525.1 major facilitator superfamily MFS_1 [Marinomonas mediterranea MMB-1]WCN10471.1 MFS transporter [Marinomonas mediterranea]WCN14519.1 MFS transporter [Marinomonas mediterranea]WCN18570.1 MFS transporter [Marinomonas mediterranea MMB-1]